ncbi:MAG: peptidoglycan-associated lipoprotein Pal [Brevundimonas sp.]|uniref:peptidoglycan-associated lipoprotein Pal n=1 Tax=Brevundimonas sp. TaxID=1871086 RepID=UPI00391B8CF7
MTSLKTLVRLSVVGLAVAAMAACARQPAQTPPATTPPPATQPGGTTPPPPPPVQQGPIGAVTPGSVADFNQNVGDRVFFDFDSYAVRSDARPRLDAQAQWLLRYPSVRVRIEGNADERGTREYNFALAARRAEAVRAYLVERGVPANRIDTISYGKERPIAQGSNEAAWAQNRNAGTVIISGAQ